MHNISQNVLSVQWAPRTKQHDPWVCATRCQKNWLLRAALHLEARPFRWVRGLKSSLVIGQKAQIGTNPFTSRGWADLVVYFFN